MLRKLSIYCLILLFTLPSIGGRASDFIERYNLNYLNMANGLPNNFVDDIFQDSKGFVWIATHGGGLVRYDGHSYLYLGQGNQGLQLKSNSCLNMSEDSFSRLWISFEERTDIIDLNTMQLVVPACKNEQLSKQLKSILSERSIRSVKNKRGDLWLVTMHHFYCLKFDNEGKVTNIFSETYTSNTPDIAVEESPKGMLVCYGGKVHLLNADKGKITDKDLSSVYPFVNGLFVTDMIYYQNHLWFGTNVGLFCDDGRAYRQGADALSHPFVSSLAISPENALMIGTLCGVDFLTKDNRMMHWNCDSPINPLGSNFVNCLFSKNHQIWVGTEAGGITKLTPRQLMIQNFLHTDNPSSLSPNAVNAMYAAKDGTIWVGTVEGGLNKLIKGTDQFVHYTRLNSQLSHNAVSTLAGDRYGRLWIGTWGGGVNIMPNMNEGQIVRFDVPENFRRIISFIGSLTFDPVNDGMWIGTNEGLYFYDFKRHHLIEPFPGCRNIRGCIGSIVTRRGALYVGCMDGMVEINLKSRNRKDGSFPKYKHHCFRLDDPESGIIEKITCFFEAKDGTLWLGSNGYGLYRQNIDKSGKVTYKAYTQRNGLANNCVKGIAENNKGVLYITTDHGLSQFNPRNELFTNFFEGDGLVSSQFYFNSAIRDAAGKIYLGSTKGMIEIAGEQASLLYKGHLSFTGLQVDNQSIFADGKYLDKDISIAKEINLHESVRSFSIEFSALNYGSESQEVYAYRMKGFEDNWIPLQPGQHSVRYTTLPAGSYEFQVRTTSSLADEKGETITIAVNVSPYFWKSWWFLTLFVILLAVLTKYFYDKRLEELRHREAERLMRPIEEALKKSEEPQQLQTRIESILANQHRIKVSQKKSIEADRIEITAKERPFMERLTEVMEENYSNSEFGVGELAEELGISRSVLSRMIVAETGEPTSQFMRTYRLEIAKDILLKNTGNRNITEIAYKVGFNDPKYFTRCFTKKYGASPSAFKA